MNKLKTDTHLLQTTVSDSCDCLICTFSGENIRKSEIKSNLESASKRQKLFKDSGLTSKEPLNPLQMIDARKGFVFRFRFCPYCGTKVDWKTIVNNCR